MLLKSRMLFIAAVLAAIFAYAAVGGQPASAQSRQRDTEVQVAVCAGEPAARLEISQPVSDSVVASIPLAVAGSVSGATQIDIFIDDSYNNTVPLTPLQKNFETSLQLSGGTHRIRLVANDICQVKDAVVELVITYAPRSVPGSGTDTVSRIDQTPATGLDTVTIAPAAADQATDAAQATGISAIPFVNRLLLDLNNLAVALDMDATVGAGGGVLGASVRTVSVVVGVASVSFAPVVAEFVRAQLMAVTQAGAGAAMAARGSGQSGRPRFRRFLKRAPLSGIVRLGGLCLVLAALFL